VSRWRRDRGTRTDVRGASFSSSRVRAPSGVPGECRPPRGSRVKAWLFEHLGEESSTGQAVVRNDRAGFQARMSDGYNPSPSYPVVPPPRCILLVYASACPALLLLRDVPKPPCDVLAAIETHWHTDVNFSRQDIISRETPAFLSENTFIAFSNNAQERKMQEKLPDCVCYLYICLKRRILEINSKKKKHWNFT